MSRISKDAMEKKNAVRSCVPICAQLVHMVSEGFPKLAPKHATMLLNGAQRGDAVACWMST